MAKEKRDYSTKYGKNAWRMQPGDEIQQTEKEQRRRRRETAKRAKAALDGNKQK